MAQVKPVVKTRTKTPRGVGPTAKIHSSTGNPISDLETESPAEIERDNEEWDTLVANTSPDKLAKLSRMFDEQLKRGGITPLDFTDK